MDFVMTADPQAMLNIQSAAEELRRGSVDAANNATLISNVSRESVMASRLRPKKSLLEIKSNPAEIPATTVLLCQTHKKTTVAVAAPARMEGSLIEFGV
jgi:hypothetical protein